MTKIKLIRGGYSWDKDLVGKVVDVGTVDIDGDYNFALVPAAEIQKHTSYKVPDDLGWPYYNDEGRTEFTILD